MKKTIIASSLLITVLFYGCTPAPQESLEQDNSPQESLAEIITCETTASDLAQNSEEYNNPITHKSMKTIPEKGDKIANIKTNCGEVALILFSDGAPETVKNFIELSNDGKYDGVPFHRVMNDFMIQGGDFTNKNGTGGHSYKGPGTYLEDEFGPGLEHIKGAVSMANAGPNTGGSQFFIVQKEDGTGWLNGAHAIFGFVYEGMNVVDAIAAQEVDHQDKPVKEVLIESIKISEF